MMSRNVRSVLAWLCVKLATASLAPKAQRWADGLMVPGGRVILTDVPPTPQVSDSSKCRPQAPTLPLRPRRINVRVRLSGRAEPWARWGQIPQGPSSARTLLPQGWTSSLPLPWRFPGHPGILDLNEKLISEVGPQRLKVGLETQSWGWEPGVLSKLEWSWAGFLLLHNPSCSLHSHTHSFIHSLLIHSFAHSFFRPRFLVPTASQQMLALVTQSNLVTSCPSMDKQINKM